MFRRDYTDMVGGLLLIAVGLAFSWYALENYRLGAVSRMGPGMFPAGLGFILACFGVILTVQGALRPGQPRPVIHGWTAGLTLLAIVTFALTVRPLGLIPAIWLLVIISSLAELKLRLRSMLALCAGLGLMAWLVFGLGLGLQVPMFNWGW